MPEEENVYVDAWGHNQNYFNETIKKIIAILLLSLTSSAFALPDCPSGSKRGYNCFGTYTSPDGRYAISQGRKNAQSKQRRPNEKQKHFVSVLPYWKRRKGNSYED